jgi:pyrimidine operon attenuation protein/uracil phosphoribosyltransferase
VAELRILTMGVGQRVRAMGLLDRGNRHRPVEPAVVGLPGKPEEGPGT